MKIPGSELLLPLKSSYGYVGTAAPSWNDKCDLRLAIDPQARMQMRLVDYYGGHYGRTRIRQAAERQLEWGTTVEQVVIEVIPIDDSIAPPTDDSVRTALQGLTRYTICGDWYVAGFRVCEEGGLSILMGYVHDCVKFDKEPCRAYAIAHIIQPSREVHLRFSPSDLCIREEGKPLFYSVHMTDLPESRNDATHGGVRVREFYFPKSKSTANGYDVRDWDFAKISGICVPTVRYSGIKDWPVIDLAELGL